MKVRKKPVEVEAVLFNHGSPTQVEKWCGGRIVYTPTGKVAGIDIPTLEGIMHASVGDWIIKGVHGEFYPCKSDIFEITYEGVAPDGSGIPVSEMRGDEAS